MEQAPSDGVNGQAVGWGAAPLREQSHRKKERQANRRPHPLHLHTSLVWGEDSAWAVAEEDGAGDAAAASAVASDADKTNPNQPKRTDLRTPHHPGGSPSPLYFCYFLELRLKFAFRCRETRIPYH